MNFLLRYGASIASNNNDKIDQINQWNMLIFILSETERGDRVGCSK